MIKKILGSNGILAKHLDNYEYRPGQIQMAETIAQVLHQGGQLLVEAGTGTGKTHAYLIPAILSGQKVVVSTGTKNLQEQLYHKDIPFLQKYLAQEFKVCYMKGRNNYLCRRRWAAFSQQIFFSIHEGAKFLSLIEEWLTKTKTGDRSELDNLPDSSPFWPEVCSKSELCYNQKCPFFDNCFITRMKQTAMQSDLIIVNHHLFFADLSLKYGSPFGSVIPNYHAVIFDEAHQVEQIATIYFGIEISNYQIEELARDLGRWLTQSRSDDGKLFTDLERLEQHNQNFFRHFSDQAEKFRFKTSLQEECKNSAANLVNCLQLLAVNLEAWEKPSDELSAYVRRCKDLAEKINQIFAVAADPQSSQVCWGEKRHRGCFLHATPLDIAAKLEERLYQKVETVIFTSATLTTQKNFEFCKKQLGLYAPRELIVPEHFNYKKQVVMYLPKHLPNPDQGQFISAIVPEIMQILDKSQGSALILFTSFQHLRSVYRDLQNKVPFNLLCQGEQPKSLLLKRFQEDVQSVLLATSSFWQGVDVPGEALSCLIIVKLPFAVPSEPLMEARLEYIAKNGGNPFKDYQIPHAAILLRQGFGRLIRRQTDKGVLAILDKRISTRDYGKVFLESLPDCDLINECHEISRFLARPVNVCV
ncbi:MAG: DEAD/DEAH box helicase [Candidatus Schekmanbacteria bacterium]|nr:DEAD/DEAH box helicase [Candidatus Schekmanbacteria bacterium]